MKWFKREQPVELKTGVYEGPVVWCGNSHYPLDEEGQPILTQRVLWSAENECYHWVDDDAPTHQHLYETRQVDLPVQQED